MRVRVSVGDVKVCLDGVGVSLRQVRGLVRLAAAVNAVGQATVSVVDEEQRAPVGFAAHIERLPEEIPKEDLSWYFDEKATGGFPTA